MALCPPSFQRRIGYRALISFYRKETTLPYNTSDSNVSNNSLVDNLIGIKLSDSENNLIIANDVSSNQRDGIVLYNSPKNLVKNNTARKNYNGITIDAHTSNIIDGNDCSINKNLPYSISPSSSNDIFKGKASGSGSQETTTEPSKALEAKSIERSEDGDSDGMGLQISNPSVKQPTDTKEIGKLIYAQIESLNWGQIVFTPP